MAGLSVSNRALWQFICGTGVLRPKELIGDELTRNKDKIFNGLLNYNTQSTPIGERLKKEKKATGVQLDFLQKLAVFLGLEEIQTYELFCSFLANDFRGTQQSLQQLLSTERHSQALIYKIRDYYYNERLYLLHCLKEVLSFWCNTDHPYAPEYAKFLTSMIEDGKLFHKLIAQFESLTCMSVPSRTVNGPLINERQELIWAHQNLKEQCAILELLLVYFKEFEIECKDFVSLFQSFKRQGFGKRQTYRHVLDSSAERYLQRISFLEVLILLEILDLENVIRSWKEDDFSEHALLKDQSFFMSLNKLFEELGATDSCHGPLLLAWTVIRCVCNSDLDGSAVVTKKMGNISLQLRVFDFLCELLDTDPFSGQTVLASACRYVVYMLLNCVLMVFQDDTLGNTEMLYELAGKVLPQDVLANDTWERGLEEGVGTLFKTTFEWFPLDYETFLNLCTAIAKSDGNNAQNIEKLFSRLQVYTEFLDRNSGEDLASTNDPLIWRLAMDKVVYDSGEFIIPKGTYGDLIKYGVKGYAAQKLGDFRQCPAIRWKTPYNGWLLIKCEIIELLQQITQGEGMVSQDQILRVTLGLQLVKEVVTSNPSNINHYLTITEYCYQILQRFCGFSPAPLDLLAICIECLTCVATKYPTEVWHKMKQTGVLPYLTENIDNMDEVISGQGLSSGQYGAILAGHECTQGRYPVTVATLELISNSVQLMHSAKKEDDLSACVLYILREVFPVYHKWRYYSKSRREQIGQKCLETFHKILNFIGPSKKSQSKRPHLQDICLYSLLYTEAGRALLDLLATGVDNIEEFLAQQGSTTEGSGVEMIQLVQMAFSVLNRLLRLKSPSLSMSPVEHALSSQPAGRQTQHIVATIAQYIFHRHNPRLPTLATLLLKRLAVVSPMSILACLGNDAEPVRDKYLSRLRSVTEDLRLKVVILELLSVSVETQPGLIEIFLNVKTTDVTEGKKDLSLGKSSCLQTVMDLMDEKKQETYMCPPDLLCACIQFIHALWDGRRETAIDVLRNRDNFWASLCAPLMRDLSALDPDDDDNYQFDQYGVKTVAYVMKILAHEMYTTESKVPEKLKKILKDLEKKNRLKYWSNYVKECLTVEGEVREINEESLKENPSLHILVAWKNWLVTISRYQSADLQVTDDLKQTVLFDLMEGMQAQFSGGLSVLNNKLASIGSALFFTLMKEWVSNITRIKEMIEQLESAVNNTCANSETLIPSIQIGLLASLLLILQKKDQVNSGKGIPCELFINLLPTVCSVLQQSTRQLPTIKEITSVQNQPTETTTVDIRFKLQSVCCCLVEELVRTIDDTKKWIPVFQEHSILNILLASLETYLKAKQGLQYVRTVLMFLLAIAKFEKGAESLAFSGLTQHTCISLISLYENGEGMMKRTTPSKAHSTSKTTMDVVTWQKMFCCCVELYSVMLSQLRYSFLEDAFNFIGAHQDKLQQGLEYARINLTEPALKEAEAICGLIHQLSFFRREWMLHLQEVLSKLLTSMVYMNQTFIGLMIRPKYLQHILTHQTDERKGGKDLFRTALPPILQHQTSTEDIDKPSAQLMSVQNYIIRILNRSLSALRQFTPSLCEVLMDQSMDVSEYDAFLSIRFSTPSLDQSCDLTFGTFLSCVNMCMRLLTKLDPRAVSPHKSPDLNISQHIQKASVLYVLENSLYLIMSQAARHLRDPDLHPREKQLLKRELGAELSSFSSAMHRYIRRGGPTSPGGANLLPSPRAVSPRGKDLRRSISQGSVITSQDHAFFGLVQEFVQKVLR